MYKIRVNPRDLEHQMDILKAGLTLARKIHVFNLPEWMLQQVCSWESHTPESYSKAVWKVANYMDFLFDEDLDHDEDVQKWYEAKYGPIRDWGTETCAESWPVYLDRLEE